MKSLGPCCSWDDFWNGFTFTWDRKHAHPTEIQPFVEKKARHYWKVYAMSGYEACITVMQKLEEERAPSGPLDPKALPPPKLKPARSR